MTAEEEPAAAEDPDFPSGDWVGFYQQAGARYRMDLYLTFRGGRVSGAGGDSFGEFSIRGRYDPESREVTFTKRYRGAHDVWYRGFREIKGIWGLWEIDGWDRSGFHIWPHGEGEWDAEALEEEVEEEVEEPARLSHPTPISEASPISEATRS